MRSREVREIKRITGRGDAVDEALRVEAERLIDDSLIAARAGAAK